MGMTARITALLVALCLFAAPQAKATAEIEDGDIIGTVLEVEGTAVLQSARDGSRSAVKLDAPVRLNDTITTGPGARIFILFIDDTELTLSENTRLTVDEYVFDPDDGQDNKARFSILQGAFKYVSGLIAKSRKTPDVEFNTHFGSIGIRGTDFWSGSTEGKYGVFVNEGAVNVVTDGGNAIVGKGLGTNIASRREAPTKPTQWGEARLNIARAMTRLKNMDAVRDRIRRHADRQRHLRERHKLFIEKRRENLQDRRIELRNQRQERLQELRQRRDDRRDNDGNTERLQKLRELQQQNPDRGGSLKQQLQEKRGQLREDAPHNRLRRQLKAQEQQQQKAQERHQNRLDNRLQRQR